MRPGGDAASYRALDPGGPKKLPKKHLWRGGRVVECTALEMRRAWKGTVGSNPTLSATPSFASFRRHPQKREKLQ